jgi:hypothetical protein
MQAMSDCITAQSDDRECRDLLHAGRAEYHYGFAGLNFDLEVTA